MLNQPSASQPLRSNAVKILIVYISIELILAFIPL
jgi:hypothetical protein